MRKLVVFILGLVVLLFVAKKYLDGQNTAPPGETSEQKRRLDNVRDKAKAFERAGDQKVDDVLRGSESK